MSRILIVEDEARIASFLRKGLTASGFATEVAADGGQALRLLRSRGFDLMVLDLGLPDMDGFDLLDELRQVDQQLPVVILTARDSVGDTVAGPEGGPTTTSPSRSASRSRWPGSASASAANAAPPRRSSGRSTSAPASSRWPRCSSAIPARS